MPPQTPQLCPHRSPIHLKSAFATLSLRLTDTSSLGVRDRLHQHDTALARISTPFLTWVEHSTASADAAVETFQHAFATPRLCILETVGQVLCLSQSNAEQDKKPSLMLNLSQFGNSLFEVAAPSNHT